MMNAILKKLFLGCASAIGFGALAVGATPSAVTEFSVTFNPLVDVAPVASWLVTGGEATATTFVQTSLRNDGGFADVSGGFSGAGSFAFTNLQAAVSAPFYYRLRSTDGVGDTFTAPVFCRRVRQLERDESDETKLASGVTMLPETNYTTDTASSVGRKAQNAFDGSSATYGDVYASVGAGPVETVIGVCLPEAAHVTDVFMYPRDSQKGRLSSAAVLSCTSSAAFEARATHLLAGKQTISSVDWHRYQPDDSETLYQCLFGYAGPLHDVGIGQFFGNVAEIRFYGWTPSDEAAAGLSIAKPKVGQDLIANAPPVISWGFTGDIITSAQLQVAESPRGPWQDLDEVQTVAGEFSFVHEDLPVGVPVYYRVSYDSKMADGYASSWEYQLDNLRKSELEV